MQLATLFTAMEKNTLLYMLSTLAQTCAALAAFVGFVGLSRLQFLEQRRRFFFDSMQSHLSSPLLPRDEVLKGAREATTHPEIPGYLQRFDAMTPAIQRVKRTLAWFEGVHLLVIVLSLTGFPFVNGLTKCPLAFWALLVLAIVAIGATGYCLRAWLQEQEDL